MKLGKKLKVSEGKSKYPPLMNLGKSCREVDGRGDGGYLVGGPSFELDVRREKEREGEGGTDENGAEQIKEGEITTELRETQKEQDTLATSAREKRREEERRILKVSELNPGL